MITNKKQMLLAFKELGWKISRDEIGDATCSYRIDCVDLNAIPGLKKIPNRIVLDSTASISTQLFSEIETKIRGIKREHASIIVSNYSDFVRDRIEKLEITLEDVRTLSNNMIAWAKAQNIELGLKKYRELSTDAKGIFPLHHLAALALNGDFKILKHYQAAFEKGDRLDFVPYITLEMIERALKIAEENHNTSQ